MDGIGWFFQNLALAVYNFFYAITNPTSWLSWIGGIESEEAKQSLMRFIYYGGSVEFFFVVFTAFILLTIIGFWKNSVMWGAVRVFETIGNTIGRFAAWAGLLMVLQQIVIVFVQRVFASAQISLGFGLPFSKDVSWWAEELKLYNAIVVCLCVSYTYIQGGQVRVDHEYTAVKYRTKKVIGVLGALLLMMPAAVLTWMFGWYFLWRHLVTPKFAAGNVDVERMVNTQWRALRWNVETVGFSPNGFNGYFLFKILLVAFAGLVFLHAIAFFYRSYLELREGPEAEGKYLDRDTLGEGEEAYEGTH